MIVELYVNCMLAFKETSSDISFKTGTKIKENYNRY